MFEKRIEANKKEGHQKWEKPRFTLFKTMGARVKFVVILVAVSFVSITIFLAYRLRQAYRTEAITDQAFLTAGDAIANQTILISGILIVSCFLLALVLGDFLITRRTRKLVRSMMKVFDGDADQEAMPRGLGELDDVTDIYNECVHQMNKAKATMATKIKTGIAEMELSKGLTELQMARLEALLASMGEGVVATDNQGRISFVNNIAKESLWWQDEKARDVPIHSAFQMEDEKEKILSDEEWPIWPALKDGQTIITQAPAKPFYLRRKDNSTFPIKMTCSPVRLGEEIVGALVVFGDITDEVEFDRRKSEFISVASHQLRSPSSAMRMMTDMMRKGDFGQLTEKQQEWAEKLYLASDNMTELINQLLNISRMEAGVKMAVEDQDTNAVIDEIIQESKSFLIEKKQKFNYQRPELPRLMFDRFMIGEVFKNFLTNAAKYSPDKSVIDVIVKIRDKDIIFSVIDKGMGIPKSDYNQMFNKFFRAGNALKSQTKGTGLGLYYCKTAAEKHGGQVGFDSEEGKGSTFWFTLPLPKNNGPEPESPPEQEVKEATDILPPK